MFRKPTKRLGKLRRIGTDTPLLALWEQFHIEIQSSLPLYCCPKKAHDYPLPKEPLDSRTTERLAPATDGGPGAKYKIHEGFSKRGYVKDSFEQWPKRIR
jgi:hypothetical protein